MCFSLSKQHLCLWFQQIMCFFLSFPDLRLKSEMHFKLFNWYFVCWWLNSYMCQFMSNWLFQGFNNGKMRCKLSLKILRFNFFKSLYSIMSEFNLCRLTIRHLCGELLYFTSFIRRTKWQEMCWNVPNFIQLIRWLYHLHLCNCMSI